MNTVKDLLLGVVAPFNSGYRIWRIPNTVKPIPKMIPMSGFLLVIVCPIFLIFPVF